MFKQPDIWYFANIFLGTPSKFAPSRDKKRFLLLEFFTSSSFVSCMQDNLHQFNFKVFSYNYKYDVGLYLQCNAKLTLRAAEDGKSGETSARLL